MLNRQKTLLGFLGGSGGAASRLQLTKWSFLLAQDTPSHGGASFYEFVPYHFGPYSFALYQEVDALIRRGLVTEPDHTHWALTEDGVRTAQAHPSPVAVDVCSVLQKWGKVPVSQLVDGIYAAFPWFTMNSKMEGRRAVKRPTVAPAVYTVGYEQLQIDGLLNLLLKSGMWALIDVRANPVSRRYGFHKSTLNRLCAHVGIDYQHHPELGIRSEDRLGVDNPGVREALLTNYEGALSGHADSVKKVARALKEKASALLCSEADPCMCHRGRLANAVAVVTGMPVKHLGWPR